MLQKPKDGLPYASEMLNRALTEGRVTTVMGSVHHAQRLAARLCVARARWRASGYRAGQDGGPFDSLVIERTGPRVDIYTQQEKE